MLGCFLLALIFAFVQQCMSARPQTTPVVVALLTLVIMIATVIGMMISIARNPMLTFAPKDLRSFIS